MLFQRNLHTLQHLQPRCELIHTAVFTQQSVALTSSLVKGWIDFYKEFSVSNFWVLQSSGGFVLDTITMSGCQKRSWSLVSHYLYFLPSSLTVNLSVTTFLSILPFTALVCEKNSPFSSYHCCLTLAP